MTFKAARAEGSRQTVHMAMGGFALLLPYLSSWQAVFCASLAVAFNLFVLHRLSATVFRPGELRRRVTSGIVIYPAAVLVLLLVFHDRPDIVAAAWGVLAIGDGAATLIGRRYPIRPLPWNARKSIGGSLAFAICGGAAAAFLAWWCRSAIVPPAYAWFPLAGALAAAVAAAAVESIPIELDDNISVPATAAAVLWCVSIVTEDGLRAFAALGWTIPAALLANIAVAWIGYTARTVTIPGAIAGMILGTMTALGAGWGGWTLLLATFALAVISTRIGHRRKLLLGIAEERGGRRGPGNAIANTGVAAVAALIGLLGYAPDTALVAFVAALAAGGSDTVASEIGKAWGRNTYLVTTLRSVAPGTSGAMSIEGTLAGIAAASLLGGLGVALQLVPLVTVTPIVAGATAGALAESAMGATLEHRGIVNNDVLNFLNTAIAAWVAVQLWRLL